MTWTVPYSDALQLVAFYGVALLVVFALILLVHSGIFWKPSLSFGKGPVRSATIAYKFELGNYVNVPRLIREIKAIAPELGILGFYYDDPTTTKKQRYAVGAVLSEDNAPYNTKLAEMFTSRGFKLFNVPDGSQYNCMRTEFPFVTKLSFLFFMHRVYPMLSNFTKRIGLIDEAHPQPYCELYLNQRILFFAPMERGQDFFVPEAKVKND